MDRKYIITSLLEFDTDIETIKRRVLNLEWDGEHVVSCSPHLIYSVLDRYVVGKLSTEDVVTWANIIECRDDIELSMAQKDIIFDLANSEITQKLSVEYARKLMDRLRKM
jgi:hypothetical protein